MSIEAMKQALEIIKNMRSGYGDDYPTEKERKTITALRQAIEEAEKQEPVAWIQEDRIVPEIGYDCAMTREHPKDLGYTPLYTAPPRKASDIIAEKQGSVMRDRYSDIDGFYTMSSPPRKEWVGLSGEELAHLTLDHLGYPTRLTAAIEAKLKEKNT